MELPIVCNMNAFTSEQRERYEALSGQLWQKVEIRDLPNGYALHHASGDAVWMEAAEFVALERRCCPFLDFALKREAASGAVWLELTGPEGTKALLREQFAQL